MDSQSQINIQTEQQEQNVRYLTFWTDRRLLGIPVTEVIQIIGMQRQITELPDQANYVVGLISLRGQIIPVIDVRLRFGCPKTEYTDRTCIVITHIQNCDFGLIVDEVDEVVDILAEQISPPPALRADRTNSYLSGIGRLKTSDGQGEKIILILHAEKILKDEEFASLAEAAQN